MSLSTKDIRAPYRDCSKSPVEMVVPSSCKDSVTGRKQSQLEDYFGLEEKRMIEFTMLKDVFALHQDEYEVATLRALRSGWYIMGGELEAFEKEFATYLGVQECIGLNSGLDALILAIRALDIGAEDEVIVPANTYIATVLGITENGARPVFVEPDAYYNLDAAKLEEALTPRTKAILCVHLYGQACNMREIERITKRHDVYLLEDCAQSHGARFEGQLTGTFGDIGCFSFYPTKPLGAAGDAGAVVTSDPELALKLRMLRNYGSRKKYENEIVGVNSRLDELQAAYLRVALQYFEEGNALRGGIAKRYAAEITHPEIVHPQLLLGATSAYHLYVIRCQRRADLFRYLTEHDIKAQIHYPIPPHLSTCYKYLGYAPGDFPITEALSQSILSLPLYAGMREEAVSAVIQAVNEF